MTVTFHQWFVQDSCHLILKMILLLELALTRTVLKLRFHCCSLNGALVHMWLHIDFSFIDFHKQMFSGPDVELLLAYSLYNQNSYYITFSLFSNQYHDADCAGIDRTEEVVVWCGAGCWELGEIKPTLYYEWNPAGLHANISKKVSNSRASLVLRCAAIRLRFDSSKHRPCNWIMLTHAVTSMDLAFFNILGCDFLLLKWGP